MKYNENLQKNARAWLVEQIRAGKSDSGLAQRFYVWLVHHGGEIGYNDALVFFLECCRAEHIHAAIINDRSVYGVYPDGIAPQPESDYREPIKCQS